MKLHASHPSRLLVPAPCVAIILCCFNSTAVSAEPGANYETWNAGFQSTYSWQRHPGYRATYFSENSLDDEAETMYTFSATAMAGLRPWTGGELYINVEAVQGVPFTGDMVGLGSFTVGEEGRAGGNSIYAYLQRLFLRQTWNQGNGSEQLESGHNQLAGMVDNNRIVLTLGNFSVHDVFTGNEYAGDSRTQFMNWSNWTYAAYDDAADDHGFGWGFALEWYWNNWVGRIGRMAGVTEPNGETTDFALSKHYGDQVELEHAHSLFGQDGKVSLLAWHNRAVLARFSDAFAYRLTHVRLGPSVLPFVRDTEQNKYGIGINLQQAVNDDLGLFLRAMKADGKTETQSFAEVDGSLSLGFSLNATTFGRSQDTLGVAFARNTISGERRHFIETGGLSLYLGDGHLQYGAERAVEIYYNLDVGHDIHITADYQRITNPAYNADRGPINFFGFRVHTEF